MRRRCAFHNLVNEYSFFPKNLTVDVPLYLSQKKEEISQFLIEWIQRHGGVKFQLSLNIRLEKYDLSTEKYIEILPWFHSICQIIIGYNDLQGRLSVAIVQVQDLFDNFVQMGSGWRIKQIEQFRVGIFRYNPLGGSSLHWKHKSDPDILKFLLRKKSILNIQGSKNHCFIYCILGSIYSNVKNSNRACSYNAFLGTLKYDFMQFPVKLSQIQSFEHKNEISVNVFGLIKVKRQNHIVKPFPMYVTTTEYSRIVNLLLYNGHYMLIRNIHGFMRPFVGKKTRYFCCKCLLSFSNKRAYNKHKQIDCREGYFKGQCYTVPEKGSTIKFRNLERQIKAPFVVYADFETYHHKFFDTIRKGKGTKLMSEQRLLAFGAKFVCKCIKFSKPLYLYVGEQVILNFARYLDRIYEYVVDILSNKREKISLNNKDYKRLDKQTKCYICGISLGLKGVRPVIDHCHLGRESDDRKHPTKRQLNSYANMACSDCNLTYSSINLDSLFINVIFHNSMSFDLHFLVRELHKYLSPSTKINVIARTAEKFLTMSFGAFRIVDSFQFLSSSLSQLADMLATKGTNNFEYTQHFIINKYGERKLGEMLPLVIRKGVMCYSYIDSLERLQECKLPPRDEFYNEITNSELTLNDYNHAVKVYEMFGCCNLEDYLKEYLAIDILLLCDIFESFRETCLDIYGLDPCYYLSSPGLSFDAMLKMTRVELDLLSDISMYDFMENGIRGGVCNAIHRHTKVENDNENIIYIDANNLYGWSMTQVLPISNFKWVSFDKVQCFNVEKIPSDSNIGYILDVDLEYPNYLHNLHNDFPLAPVKGKVMYSELSPYAKSIIEKFHMSYTSSTSKLLTTLNHRKRYIVHYINLKLYLALGMKLKKVHRILQFNQSSWMKDYVQFNTMKRKEATNSFEKNLFKLMTNSTYGKCMERLRGRSSLELTSSPIRCQKLLMKPSFKSVQILDDDFVGIQYLKSLVELNKPIYVGFTILDLSKWLLYDFHYNKILPTFNSPSEEIRLLYQDTDSFVYYIKSPYFIEKMRYQLRHSFDFSSLPPGHSLYSCKNVGVLGMFKDETGGKKIDEFICLRPKMYSLKYSDGSNLKKMKGVGKRAVQDIFHESYFDSLNQMTRFYGEMMGFRSYNHRVFIIAQDKLALTPFEDKRYILNDGISSRAYGHYLNNK